MVTLVVGAGPVGLTVAAELARRGVPVGVVDAASGPSTTSKAIGMHARTLELLEGIGVTDTLVDLGVAIRAVRFHDRGRWVADLTFAGLPTCYPFALSLGQDVTERVLLDRARELGVDIEWGVRLEDLRDRGDRVEVTLVRADGDREQRAARWVVGCDGAHSTVRRRLDVTFDGTPFPEWFVVADLHIDADLDGQLAHLFLSAAGATAVFPLPEPGLARLATPLAADDASDDPPEVDLAAVERLWASRVGRPARLSDPQWISPFRFHSRLAARYRVGRVLLAGDAAHVHSPVGGQGMNAGMHDAVNLAWKLEAVERGAPDDLLDTYGTERRPAAARMLAETRRNAVMVSTDARAGQALRNRVLRTVARVGPIRRRILSHVSMLSVSYEPGQMPGAVTSSWWRRVRKGPAVGDRAPDATVASGDRTVRLFDLLRAPRHVLLCFDAGAAGVRPPPDPVTGHDVDVVVIRRANARSAALRAAGEPLDAGSQRLVWDPLGEVHRTYRVRRSTTVLVRPDKVIAWRGPLPPTTGLRAVLDAMLPAEVG